MVTVKPEVIINAAFQQSDWASTADTALPGPLDVRLECTVTRQRLRTELRGARQFLSCATDAGR